MSGVASEYKRKLVSAEKAVLSVKSGDWVDYGMAHSIPVALDKALAARKDEIRDVKVRACLSLGVPEIVKVDPQRQTFTYSSWHFGAVDRRMYNEGKCFFIPLLYRDQPGYYRDVLDVDVAMVRVTPVDKHGYFGFSLVNSSTAEILRKARTVIVEVNENLPPVFGKRECVHISEVHFIVESENDPLVTMPVNLQVDELDQKIARYIIEEIQDGSVLQLGIGSLPDAVGRMIVDTDLKDLGMHTEMLVDSYYDLFRAGKLTNRQKQIDGGKGVWTFCVGSEALYEWVKDNRGLMSAPVDYCNSPRVVSQNDRMVGVNNCVEMDLFGQVCSESVGIRHVTGTGGQLDFVDGCRLSKGGKCFVCMSSVFWDKNGQAHSRIVPLLQNGAVVTDPRSYPVHIVTEYGKINTAGMSVWERAEGLISLAHPDFREELISAAEKMNIWRRSNKI